MYAILKSSINYEAGAQVSISLDIQYLVITKPSTTERLQNNWLNYKTTWTRKKKKKTYKEKTTQLHLRIIKERKGVGGQVNKSPSLRFIFKKANNHVDWYFFSVKLCERRALGINRGPRFGVV